MRKILCVVVVVVCMLFAFSACTESSEKPLNRNQELVGCWVTKSSDGLIGGIQFFSDGTFYEEYQTGERYDSGEFAWTRDVGTFCAEFDGTLIKNSKNIFDYKLENNRLIIFKGEKTQEFTKWDKNISHIEEYSEN